MSDYPVTEIIKDPDFVPITINRNSLSPGGGVRSDSHNTYDSYSFKITHRAVSTATKNAVLSHYSTEKLNEFNYLFTVTGLTYVCQYQKEPLPVWLADGVWDVVTEMIGHE